MFSVGNYLKKLNYKSVAASFFILRTSNFTTSICENKPILISSSAIKGRRPYMEDEFLISENKLYNAVFDGIEN